MLRSGCGTGRVGVGLAVVLAVLAGCGTRVRQLDTDPGVAEGEGSAGSGGSDMLPGSGSGSGSDSEDPGGVPGDGPIIGAGGSGAGDDPGNDPGDGMVLPPSSGECRGDVPAFCLGCPDGSCGEAVCVMGSWEFRCTGDPGAPNDPSVCPDFLPQICKQCPDGSCGEPVCFNGAWGFVCRNVPVPPPPPCGPCGFYEPVCGFDGVTYNAACGMGCIPTEIACRGECPCFTDPCLNNQCGGFCDPCGGDPNCVSPGVPFFCDEKLQCTSRVPVCDQPAPACMVMADCPGIRVCVPCPDGRCAVQACLDYSCQLVCAL